MPSSSTPNTENHFYGPRFSCHVEIGKPIPDVDRAVHLLALLVVYLHYRLTDDHDRLVSICRLFSQPVAGILFILKYTFTHESRSKQVMLREWMCATQRQQLCVI